MNLLEPPSALWEWVWGDNRDRIGADERLRNLEKAQHVDRWILIVAVLASNPITAHFINPLLPK